MKDQISIAFACDDNYAKHVAVVMQSIFANAAPGDRHEFHILTMGLTSETERRLRSVVAGSGGTLTVHQIAEKNLISFPNNRQTLNAYLRLFLPEILPDHNKVLYLDADLLVFTSLSSLWQHSLDKFAIAAATDSMFYFTGSAEEYFHTLNLSSEHRYFNSGVMLLNLEFLREFKLLKKILEWVTDNAHLMVHSDQDALNAILIDKVNYLHVAWNLQIPLIYPVRFGWGSTQELFEAVTKPAIIHYVTGRKPWLRQYKLPYQNLYFQYLAQTPWKDDPLPPYTLAHRLDRLREEWDWCYKWSRSEVRRLLGRHPKPVPEFSSTNTFPTALAHIPQVETDPRTKD
jgi:lipopolysaccharide biosynthesis glycosyltransferase